MTTEPIASGEPARGAAPAPRIRIGVDTGGTFTDIVAVDEATGQVVTTKTPSTPADPSVAFLAGVAKVLEITGADGAAVASVAHGTTVATNQLLEGHTGRLGFITTEGYEFILEIARQSVPDGYGNSYFWVKPPRIVPAGLVRTVGGRLDASGTELRPFDRAEAAGVARWFRDQGVTAIGVCFLHAYADPSQERATNGGVLSATEIVKRPVTTVLSGPAAGALGAALIAREAGFGTVLTLDGGGTSTDVALVLDGAPAITTEGMVGDYPSRIPMIDVVSVGGGGGSIAWISPEGTLTVGPRSAGADPGPICYGTGGTEPTVTDAHVVLGRIPPRLLGGGIPLDAGAARAGLEQLGATLGLDAEATARGILEISAWNQAHALRQISVQRGLDVRDFVLATFGGSGSLLACRLAGILGLAGVVVPLDPGTVSAYGLLTVDVRTDHVRTAVQRDDALDLRRVAAVYAELELAALGALAAEGFAAGDGQLVRTADLRYAGQAYEVRVTAPGGPVDAAFARAVAGAFHAGHRARYGYAFEGRADQAVEWVNLRVTGIGPIERPRRGGLAAGDGDPERALAGRRRVVFDEAHDGVPVYRRAGTPACDPATS